MILNLIRAKIDSKNLGSGENDFSNLPNLFVIVITDYDPFGYDYMMYTVHNQSIKKLLNYMKDSTINNVTDEVTQKLHDCISKVKVLPEVRMEYMKWDAMIYYERRDAKNEGKIEGKIESILELLEELGEVSEELKGIILKETDLEKIKTLHKLAAKVNSIEEFVEKM